MPLRDAREHAGVVDLDAVARRAALAREVGEQAAVAAAEVEHARAARDPGGDRREVGAAGRRGGGRNVGRRRRAPVRRRATPSAGAPARSSRRPGSAFRGDALEVRAHDRQVLRIVEQERVVAVRRDDLRVRHVAVVVDQRLDDLARARRREAPVGGERDDEEPARRRRERAREVAARRERRIEIVERLGDAQVGVRVVVLGELLALVAQVRLDLELRRERELEAVAQRAAEFLLHLLVGQVGDVADHPRDAQAAPRLRAVRVEVAVVKIRVGEDRLARDLVERDVLRRQVRRGGDHQRVADARPGSASPRRAPACRRGCRPSPRPTGGCRGGRRAAPARRPSPRP